MAFLGRHLVRLPSGKTVSAHQVRGRDRRRAMDIPTLNDLSIAQTRSRRYGSFFVNPGAGRYQPFGRRSMFFM